jgi:two-component system nitrate/nitrite response regulator NarL
MMPADAAEATSDSRQLTLLIVDDHRIFAEVLAARLEREPRFADVLVANGLDEASAVARRARPDVVILDYHIDGETGTRLIGELHGLPDPPPVVMLSASDVTSEIIDSLQAGAAAWVLKGTQLEVLLQAIDEVLQGRTYLYPTTVRPVVEQLLHDRTSRQQPTFVDELSERQLQVLRCLVAGLTRAETAQRLYISPNTVRTHVQNLLQATGEHSTVALVARARAAGVTGIDDSAASPGGSSA